jgi:hypothetical protein
MADGARGERWDLAWHKAGGAPVTSPQGLVVAAVHALRRRPGPIRAPHGRYQRLGSPQQLVPPRRVLWHTAEVVLLRFILREIELDKDFAGYPPTPPENPILINTLAVAS